MATRTLTVAVYKTDGTRYTDATAPTATVQYGTAAASSVTMTQRGSAWSFDVDDSLDGVVLWTGTGIVDGDLSFTRLPASLANLDAAVSSRLATSGYTAPLTDAQTRSALGLAAANLDTQIAAIIGDTVAAGYTRITSATYGALLPGTVIDAYAAADTTYATPLVPNVTVASNGSWHTDLPDAATYTLVGRLAGKDDTTQTVVIP